MKKIHLGLCLCFVLLVRYGSSAQTPVIWSGSVQGPTFQAVGNPPSYVGTNGIEANQDGWVEFTFNAKIGNCKAGFGFGDASNSTQAFNNTFLISAFSDAQFDVYHQSWANICHDYFFGADNAGTKVKVERVGTLLKYYHNNILKCTQNVLAGIKLMPVIVFYPGENGKSVNVSAQISGPGVNNPTPVVQFDYDEVGNRIKRKYVTVLLPRSSKATPPETTNIEAFALKVFPNPSDGHFEITIEKSEDGMMLEIYDVAGKQVHKQPVAGLNTSVDVSHLARGIYVLTCRDAQKIKGQWKLMIQ
jgi:hypothetical protein